MVTSYFDNFTMPLILTGMVILPLFINAILPQYSESIFMMRMLLLAYGFQNFSFTPSSYLVSNGMQNSLVFIVVLSLILMISGNFLVINLGFGIKGVVVATALVFLINSMMMYFASFRGMGNDIPMTIIKIFYKRVTIFFICIFVLFNNYSIAIIILSYFLIYSISTYKSIKKLLKLI